MGCPAGAPPARVLVVPPPEDARACKKHHLPHWEANPLEPTCADPLEGVRNLSIFLASSGWPLVGSTNHQAWSWGLCVLFQAPAPPGVRMLGVSSGFPEHWGKRTWVCFGSSSRRALLPLLRASVGKVSTTTLKSSHPLGGLFSALDPDERSRERPESAAKFPCEAAQWGERSPRPLWLGGVGPSHKSRATRLVGICILLGWFSLGWEAFPIVSVIPRVGFPAVISGSRRFSCHGESSRAGSHSGEFDRSLPVATLARSRDGVMLMKTELTRSEDRAGLFVLEGPRPGGRAMGDGLPSWT